MKTVWGNVRQGKARQGKAKAWAEQSEVHGLFLVLRGRVRAG